MKISILIINYNTQELTLRCVKSLFATTTLPLEVIVIDNGSKKFEESSFIQCGVTVIRNRKNLGFAGGVNSGINNATGDLIILMNSDAIATEGMVEQFITQMLSDDHIGIIGPRTVYPDGSHQVSSGKFPSIMRELMRFTPLYKILPISTYLPKNIFTKKYFGQGIDIDWVSGGCMALRRTCMVDIGLLDERYFFGVEDWDYCFRAKDNDWRVIYDSRISIIHAHGGSVGGNKALFKEVQEQLGSELFYQTHYPHDKILPYLTKLWYNVRIRRAT